MDGRDSIGGWSDDPSRESPLLTPTSPGTNDDDEAVAIDESDVVAQSPIELDRAEREALEREVRLLTDESDRTSDGQRATLLLFHAGNLLAWRLHDNARAAKTFLAAVERAPYFVPAIRAARRLLLIQRRLGPALDLFEREIASAADADSRAALHAETAFFAAARLGDLDRAHVHLRRALEASRAEGIAERDLWRFLARLRDHSGLERHLATWFESTRHDHAAVGFRLALMKERRKERAQALDILAQIATAPGDLAPVVLPTYAAFAGGVGRWNEETRALEDLSAYLCRSHPIPAPAPAPASAPAPAPAPASDDRGRSRGRERERSSPSDHVHDHDHVHAVIPATAPASASVSASAPAVESVAGLEVFLGLLAETRSPAPASARAHFRRALALDPTDAIARAALRDALGSDRRGTSSPAEALALAEESVDVAPDDAASWFAVAEALEAAQADDDLAISAYRRALALDPAATEAQSGLGRLLSRLGRDKETAELFVEQASRAATVDERAALLYRAADILGNRAASGSGEAQLAIELYEEVVRLIPNHAPAQRALGSAYTREGRWSDLANLLDAEIATARGLDHRVFLLDRLASLSHDRLRDAPRAITAYRRILELSPAHLGALRSLARLLAEDGCWRELVDVNLREVELTTDRTQIAALLHRSGEILDEKLGDTTTAATMFERVLLADPLYVPSLRALGRLYIRTGNFRALHDMTERELDAVSQAANLPADTRRARRIALLLRLGTICRDNLGDDEAAAKAFRAVLDEDPLNAGAHGALVRISARLRDSATVEALYEESWRRSEGDQRALLALKLAVLRLSRGDRNGAKEMLADSPMSSAARSLSSHIARLEGDWERAAQLAPPTDAAWISAFLEDRPTQAARQLLSLAAASPNPSDDAGSSALHEMVFIESRALSALEALYDRLARTIDDPARARVFATLGARLARESPLDGGMEAERAFLNRLTTLEPSNLHAWLRLADIARTRHDARALTTALEHLVPFARDRAEKVAALMELAQIAKDDLGNPDIAANILKEIVGIAPDFVPAWEAIERIAMDKADWVSAATAAEAAGDRADDAARGVRDLKRAAEIWKRRVRDAGRAADVLFRAAERVDGVDGDVVRELEEILRGLCEWSRLVDFFTLCLGRTRDPETRRELLLKTAEIERRELRDRDGALRRLRDAVEIPSGPSERAVYQICAAEREIALLEAERHEWTRALLAWEEVVRRDGGGDAGLVREAVLAQAAIHEQRLHDPDRALEAYHRLLAREPSDKETLGLVANVFEARGDADNARRAVERLLNLATSPEERAGLGVRLGQISANLAGDVGAARDAVERALAADPHCRAAVEQLRAWAEKSDDSAMWTAWVNAATHVAQSTPGGDRAERVRRHLAIAGVLDEKMNDPARAAEQLRAALSVDETCRDARTKLFDLLMRRDETRTEAIREGRRLLRRAPDSIEILAELVRLYDAANDVEHAFVHSAVLAALTGRQDLARLQPRAAELYERAVRSLAPQSRPIAPADRAQFLAHPSATTVLHPLLLLIANSLPRVFGTDLSAFGVTKSSRVRESSGLWDDVMRIADRVGTRDFHIFVAERQPTGIGPLGLVAVAATSPACLILSPEARDLIDTPRARFWLGGAIEWIRGGLAALCGRTALEIEILCEALAFGAGEGRGTLVAPRETLERTWRIVSKDLSRAAKRELPPLIANWVSHRNECSFDAFRLGLVAAADRVGLLVAVDPAVAVGEALRARNDEEAAADLVAFVESDEYFAVRRRVGLALDGADRDRM